MPFFMKGRSRCAICDQPIAREEEVFSLSAVGDILSDFWRLFDANTHRECLRTWDRRDEFVAYYNQSVMETPIGIGGTLVVLEDGGVEYYSVVQYKNRRTS